MLPHVMLNKTTHPCGGNARPKNDVVPSLPPYNQDAGHRLVPPFLIRAVTCTFSWLRSRRIRYLLLLLFSPLILCLLFFAFPFLCAVDLCLRRRIWRKLFRDSRDNDRLRRCEEGCGGCSGDEEKGLLHRYLEDQLLLVGSMYECGDDEDEEALEEIRSAHDVANLHIRAVVGWRCAEKGNKSPAGKKTDPCLLSLKYFFKISWKSDIIARAN